MMGNLSPKASKTEVGSNVGQKSFPILDQPTNLPILIML